MRWRSVGRRVPSATLVATLAWLSGCVRLSQPAPIIRDYRLEYAPPVITGAPLPAVLRVPDFSVAAIYDRAPIVYREGAYATGVYYYNRWSANPGEMIADLLVRDFAAPVCFAPSNTRRRWCRTITY
jgi:uncharacterized lipoprotein YmbA